MPREIPPRLEKQTWKGKPLSILHGGCLCGRVRYEVEDRFVYAGYCHCSECRRTSGSAFAALGGCSGEAFRVTQGEDVLSSYQKGPNTLLYFCSKCGSNLFTRKPETGFVHVRLGTLDEPPTARPMGHVFVGSKAAWFTITDQLPQFPEGPPALPR